MPKEDNRTYAKVAWIHCGARKAGQCKEIDIFPQQERKTHVDQKEDTVCNIFHSQHTKKVKKHTHTHVYPNVRNVSRDPRFEVRSRERGCRESAVKEQDR